MTIEEILDRVVLLGIPIQIEYCTRNGRVFTCEIENIGYSQYFGGGYIIGYRKDIRADRTFKISRIQKVNGHSFTRIYWNQLGDHFNRI